jgi:hypothetical protein
MAKAKIFSANKTSRKKTNTQDHFHFPIFNKKGTKKKGSKSASLFEIE